MPPDTADPAGPDGPDGLLAVLADHAAAVAPPGPCLILTLIDDSGPEPLMWSLVLSGGLDPGAAARAARTPPAPGFVDARICAAAVVDPAGTIRAERTAADLLPALRAFATAAWPCTPLQHVVVVDRGAGAWWSMHDGLLRWIGGADPLDPAPAAGESRERPR